MKMVEICKSSYRQKYLYCPGGLLICGDQRQSRCAAAEAFPAKAICLPLGAGGRQAWLIRAAVHLSGAWSG
jgi:hypothetical protein